MVTAATSVLLSLIITQVNLLLDSRPGRALSFLAFRLRKGTVIRRGGRKREEGGPLWLPRNAAQCATGYRPPTPSWKEEAVCFLSCPPTWLIGLDRLCQVSSKFTFERVGTKQVILRWQELVEDLCSLTSQGAASDLLRVASGERPRSYMRRARTWLALDSPPPPVPLRHLRHAPCHVISRSSLAFEPDRTRPVRAINHRLDQIH